MEEIYVDFGFIYNMRNSNKLYKYEELNMKNAIFDSLFVVHNRFKNDKSSFNYKHFYGNPYMNHGFTYNEFKELPFAKYLKKYNFVLAGGSIYSILLGDTLHDYDFFIIGQDNVKNRIIGFINEIREPNAEIYVTKNCITIKNIVPVQIILRIYNSIDELLNDFDMGDIMMSFDGDYIYVNEEGKFTHETNYLIINLSKYNQSYSHRLTRHDYGIVHTNLK